MGVRISSSWKVTSRSWNATDVVNLMILTIENELKAWLNDKVIDGVLTELDAAFVYSKVMEIGLERTRIMLDEIQIMMEAINDVQP